MTQTTPDGWPTADLDPVTRLRVLAAGIPGARVTERLIHADLDQVWAVASDLEGEFCRYQPDMKSLRILHSDGTRLEAMARGHLGFRARFDVVLRPGWCWMQSRFLLVGTAATPVPGGTLVAWTGGLRIPGRAGILGLFVRREAHRTLRRLDQRITTRTRP